MTNPAGHRSDPDFALMPYLLPRPLRRHVRAFSRFARLADTIADDVSLPRLARVQRLQRLEACLIGRAAGAWNPDSSTIAQDLRQSLGETGVSPQHALLLLSAFRRDAKGHVNRSWADVLAYCQEAAAPVGRYMLDLSGEDTPSCAGASDALCAAQRILRQLRDCRNPQVGFNRLCIPQQFLEDALITPEQLRTTAAKGQVRAVLDRVLDGVDQLCVEAAPLPGVLRRRGLVIHAATVHCRARKFTRLLRRHDPLHERVGLTPLQRFTCRLGGTLTGFGLG